MRLGGSFSSAFEHAVSIQPNPHFCDIVDTSLTTCSKASSGSLPVAFFEIQKGSLMVKKVIYREGYIFPLSSEVMQYCENRSLREEMYRAYITIASAGELDNAPVMSEILQLRQRKAKLLGYETYADLSMAAKMATYDCKCLI